MNKNVCLGLFIFYAFIAPIHVLPEALAKRFFFSFHIENIYKILFIRALTAFPELNIFFLYFVYRTCKLSFYRI